MKKLILSFGLLVPTFSFAQSYSIDWYTVSGSASIIPSAARLASMMPEAP